MKTYSLDLREKVMAAIEAGELSHHRVAAVFAVSYDWIKKLLRQKRELGHIRPLPHGGGNPPRLDERAREALGNLVREQPDAILEELCRKVKTKTGARISPSAMCRTLARMGLSWKKKDAQRSGAGSRSAKRASAAHRGAPARRAAAHLHR